MLSHIFEFSKSFSRRCIPLVAMMIETTTRHPSRCVSKSSSPIIFLGAREALLLVTLLHALFVPCPLSLEWGKKKRKKIESPDLTNCPRYLNASLFSKRVDMKKDTSANETIRQEKKHNKLFVALQMNFFKHVL